MIRLGCLLLVVLLVGVPAVAAQFLPWWAVVLVFVGEVALLVLSIPKLIKFGFTRFAMGLFTTKSRVLHGAGVHVHRVEAVEKPGEDDEPISPLIEQAAESPVEAHDDDNDEEATDDAEDESADRADYRYVLVEFTLTPRPGQSKMTHYEPSEIMLIPFDQKVAMDQNRLADGIGAAVESIAVIDESGNETPEFDKLTGKSRLRAVFACPPLLTGRVKFQYYFETFGDLLLP